MLEYIYIFNIYIEMCLEIDSFDLLIQPKLFFSLPTDYYSVLQSLLLVFVREVITYTVVQDFHGRYIRKLHLLFEFKFQTVSRGRNLRFEKDLT